nr:uncharacterized protein LOC109169324 [Ipomoea batatas]
MGWIVMLIDSNSHALNGAHEVFDKMQRGIEIVTPDAWNLGTSFLAQPGDAFDSIVREFYANAKDGVETHQCIVRGVAVNFSPADINAYYGQVPDPDDAENEDQANDEAMEDPAPAAHAPDQFPPQYNMEQFFARQEEFMRRQEIFMTRHEGYMRRSDDINWWWWRWELRRVICRDELGVLKPWRWSWELRGKALSC